MGSLEFSKCGRKGEVAVSPGVLCEHGEDSEHRMVENEQRISQDEARPPF